jgi:putative membrane protein
MEPIVIVIKSLTGLMILLHLYFMYLEMFAWTTRGPKVFKGFSKESFETTKVLAGNQGLYNGFLAAGLIWSMLIRDAVWANKVSIFFLICVLVAGVYGAVTVTPKIFFIQALPAIATLILMLAL